jgi:hypothetical protein
MKITHSNVVVVPDDPAYPTGTDEWNADHAVLPSIVTITDGVGQTFDAQNGKTDTARLTATADRTLVAPTNPSDGQRVVIEHNASGGARTLSLTTGSAGAFVFGTDITALSATASGSTDEILVIYNTAANRWRVSAVVKGF